MASEGQYLSPLTGVRQLLAGLVLAIANFMVVLDMTIANVSVPHISGSLGVSMSQGTWIITSYAVAEAICVPLTGWLAGRFGTVRLYILCMIGFGIFSFLCGISTSLPMLLMCRIGQGLCGGPIMPLTQTLLLRVFRPKQRAKAMGVWAMTTILAPVMGPILGGTISDNWSWHWIFFINIPVAIGCSLLAMRMLGEVETEIRIQRVDAIGLALMIFWIAALQIMLDLGREHDWFADPMIVTLAVVAGVGFLVFIAWELTEEHPIVDIRVFRHLGFTMSTLSLAFTFGAYFASVVIIPQWLQSSLGYTATWAGYAVATAGVLAMFMAPVVANLVQKMDPRLLISGGIMWLGFASFIRYVTWNANADFFTLTMPQLVQGVAMPMFMIPLTIVGLAAVDQDETASAAGIMSFMRTMAGAIGTSIATTAWDDTARTARTHIVDRLSTDAVEAQLAAHGFSPEQIRKMIENLVEQQAYAVSTTHLFGVCVFVFLFAAAIVWLSPRPTGPVDTSAAH